MHSKANRNGLTYSKEEIREKMKLSKCEVRADCPLTDQHATVEVCRCSTPHLVSVTAAVVYGLYRELAPVHEEGCTPFPPSV